MTRGPIVNRRGFFKLGAAAGAGLVIGYPLARLLDEDEPSLRSMSGALEGDPALWLKIAPDGEVTVILPRCEMGQGTMTALPMLVAEELEVDWSKIRTKWAPLEPAYGRQLTGASDAVRSLWGSLREAGALARQMLVLAAAHVWEADRSACRAANGAVVHLPTGRSLTYGVLADAAATLPLPYEAPLKHPEAFRLIGRPLPRLDLPAKVTGRAVYGWDVAVPGMLVATVVHSPVLGGTLRSFDASPSKAIAGVRDVVCLDDGRSGCSAIAVVADNFWTAQRGLRALQVTWDDGPNAAASTASVLERFSRLAERDGRPIVERGLPRRALATATRRLDAIYETPYLAHATMEPMSCTARVGRGTCEVWVPTQYPTLAREVAARAAGLSPASVTIHQTYLGGGFGRRQRADVVDEAVRIAKAVGAPIKLLWSREEDIRHGYYRPATYHQASAGLDADGAPVAWLHGIVGIGASDSILVQGVDDIPYDIPNKRITLVRRGQGPVQTGPWRGLARSQNTFVTESCLDDIAHAGGRDPLALRLALLVRAPRYVAVLERAAEAAGWGRPLPAGRHRGLALCDNFGGLCAQVAEVSIANDGGVRVHRIVCTVDCGQIVNPDIVMAQIEGGIVFGLSATLNEQITIAAGRVEQSNFHDYSVLRMHEVPAIEVHLVESREAPGGVGETSLPPVAPAVANAVFAAAGKRLRRLPLGRVDA